MITRKRIRELLREHALNQQQLDAIAAYCDSVQYELAEQDVHDIVIKLKKKV